MSVKKTATMLLCRWGNGVYRQGDCGEGAYLEILQKAGVPLPWQTVLSPVSLPHQPVHVYIIHNYRNTLHIHIHTGTHGNTHRIRTCGGGRLSDVETSSLPSWCACYVCVCGLDPQV